MAEQPALAVHVQDRGVFQYLHAARLCRFGPEEEIPIAMHEVHRCVSAVCVQQRCASADESVWIL